MRPIKPVSKEVRYFFKNLEKRAAQIKADVSRQQGHHKELHFPEVEQFFRDLMTQNIFIHTVGLNGKPESTILAKALFSMNKVVRLYYSTSFDERNSGFIRVRPDATEQTIIVERLHGLRPQGEVLYVSADECHIIRFLTRWLLRRIDWSKTKLNNLDLYRRFKDEERVEWEQKIADEQARLEEIEVQRTMEKHLKGRPARDAARNTKRKMQAQAKRARS